MQSILVSICCETKSGGCILLSIFFLFVDTTDAGVVRAGAVCIVYRVFTTARSSTYSFAGILLHGRGARVQRRAADSLAVRARRVAFGGARARPGSEGALRARQSASPPKYPRNPFVITCTVYEHRLVHKGTRGKKRNCAECDEHGRMAKGGGTMRSNERRDARNLCPVVAWPSVESAASCGRIGDKHVFGDALLLSGV